jgi:hypothetical protein
MAPCGAYMFACDLCKQLKPDVQRRPLLRVPDQHGVRTVDPFKGMLCDHCYEHVQKFGTSEHTWVLKQISQMPARRRAQQY